MTPKWPKQSNEAEGRGSKYWEQGAYILTTRFHIALNLLETPPKAHELPSLLPRGCKT
jgi:hypothetical protein